MNTIDKNLKFILQETDQREQEDKLLVWLFKQWQSDEGHALQCFLEQRAPMYDTPDMLADYYKSTFIFILDDANRLNFDVAQEKILSHWFYEETDIEHRLDRLTDGKEKESVSNFVDYMRTLGGAKTGENRSYRYGDSKNPRASILWNCALCVIAEYDAYNRGSDCLSVFGALEKSASNNIFGSGFEGVNFENALDVYIAFSAYRAIKKLRANQAR